MNTLRRGSEPNSVNIDDRALGCPSLFRILCVRHSMATERSLHDSQEQERGGHDRGAV
jgi:hypothetical protein